MSSDLVLNETIKNSSDEEKVENLQAKENKEKTVEVKEQVN